MEHEDLVNAVVELKITIEGLRKDIANLSSLEERLINLEGRTIKVEQKVLLLYTIVGGGIGALISAIIYKIIDQL